MARFRHRWIVIFATLLLVMIGGLAAWRHDAGGHRSVFAPTTHSGGPFVQAPRQLVLGDGLTVKDITWSDWGAGTAFARGRLVTQECFDRCSNAASQVTLETTVTLKASDVGRCGPRLVYRQLSGSRADAQRGCAYS